MPQFNPFKSARKAGQLLTNTDRGRAVLIGGGVGLGTLAAVKLLQQLSPAEQDEVMKEAIAAESGEGGDTAMTFGVPAGSLLAAGILVESMNRDADRELQDLTDVVIDVNGGNVGDTDVWTSGTSSKRGADTPPVPANLTAAARNALRRKGIV